MCKLFPPKLTSPQKGTNYTMLGWLDLLLSHPTLERKIMALTEQVIEALQIAKETRRLLLACMKESTPEKLRKANMHHTQCLAELLEAIKLIEKLIKQNNEDLTDIIRLENA